LSKNINKSFLKFYLEKDVKIITDGGWHFNNLYSLNQLSQKIKVSPHQEFNKKQFYDTEIIKKKIKNLQDLYNKGFSYQKLELTSDYPEYILNNKSLFKDFIL